MTSAFPTSQDHSPEATLPGPTLDVIIPTFRRSDMLTRAIDAIIGQGRPIEKILLVHRPNDDPDAVEWLAQNAARYPNLVPVDVYVPGKVAAQNAALARADADFIVIIDDDIVLRPGWLDTILPHFDDPGVAVVGGKDIVHGPGGSAELPPKTRAGYRNFWGKVIGNHNVVVGGPRYIDAVKGCNWAVRRSALGTLRFDDRLLGIGAQAGDDYWFCLNLRHAGWKIVLDPSAVVDHYPAYKPDYAQGSWGKAKCYEWTANITAHNLAFLPLGRKALYIGHALAIGVRHCPGAYYFAHSLAKRPGSVVGQMSGGWAGFVKGLAMCRDFERNPPGVPAVPPSAKAAGHG